MRKDVHTYSASFIIAALGAHIVSGYAKDSFVSIAPLGDGVTDESGADGEVVVSISQDPRYEVKLTLVYGSATNDWLLAKYRLNQQSPGSGFFPILIKDLGDGPILSAETAWVMKPANVANGATAGTQEWTLHCVGELTPQ